MTRIDRRLLPLLAFWCLATVPARADDVIKVLAAGSLTGALNAVIASYKDKTGVDVEADYGPAGLLLERIQGGERADIFVSANMAHPRALADRGMGTRPVVMARNTLCARARPEFGLTTQNVFDRLMDPKVGIGTSTPKADPGGDYAWLMFDKAGKVRPGAAATLKAKAQQLVGGAHNPPVPAGRNAMDYFFDEHKIDISLGYCSSRETTANPRYTTVQLPPDLAVTADYGMTVLSTGKADRAAALRFALFIMGAEAQLLIGRYGFDPVAVSKGEQ